MKSQKDREIDRLEKAYRGNLERSNVTIVNARATLVDAHRVALSGSDKIFSANRILIATGARPYFPDDVPGIEHAESSDDFFDWDRLPRSVVIVGAGYIGVEFACMLQRLGVKVTLVIRRDKVLPRFDEDLRIALNHAMQEQGIVLKTNTSVARIEGERGRLVIALQDGSSLACDRIVYATGRVPNVRGLGLEAAGVKTGKNGAISVDEDSATSVPSIHAVGDVTDRVALTPVAIREGHAYADTYFGNKPVRASHDMIATAVFSTPELGTVGLTEAEARERYKNVVIYRTDFRPMKATLSGRSERVLMKLVVDGDSDKMLGVHILGEASGEMIQCLGIAMRMGATKQDFDMTMAVHPTAAEELVTLRTPYKPH